VLAGYDQRSNVVLSDSKERVYSMDEGVEEVPLGLYLVKGDMMYVLIVVKLSHVLITHCPVIIIILPYSASSLARLMKNVIAQSTSLPSEPNPFHPFDTR
jgi:hypothetical protein